MRFVKYRHITNKSRVGETSLENWNKKAKETNLLLYWEKVEEFDKSQFVPAEAAEIISKKDKTKGNVEDIE